MGTYIRFKSEKIFESIKFPSNIIAKQEIIHYLKENKNIRVGQAEDKIDLFDVDNKSKH